MKLHVFYNGTDSNYNADFKKENRFIHGEIVSRFGHYALEGANNKDNILRIHGVGGSKENTGKLSSGIGTGFGLKMREDVNSIVAFAMKARSSLIKKNQVVEMSEQDKILSITLMGWSRGGIGCIYAAHMLAKVWDELEKSTISNIVFDIKIIAFDPVSGLGTNMKALNIDWSDTGVLLGSTILASIDPTAQKVAMHNIEVAYNNIENWWELPKNVSEYHGFYAHDERSVGFAPTIPTMAGNPEGRSFNIYSVPGTHSTLVGNLYPNGGSTPSTDKKASPVGLHIYRSVVRKTMELMTRWLCTFDNKIHSDWIDPLNVNNDISLAIITPEELISYKTKAQLALITFNIKNPMNQYNILGVTDGRGVYIGGNTLDRKWKPESTLKEFMNEDNAKSILDSIFSFVNGKETKLEKIGKSVNVHDFGKIDFNWT